MSDWMEAALEDVHTAMKLKDAMFKRGLTAARAKCPRCGNETLWAG